MEATMQLPPQSSTLSPLPDYHRRGLVAVVVFAFMSCVSCTSLFLHLTYKLVRWHIKARRHLKENRRQAHAVDLSLGLAQQHFGSGRARPGQAETQDAGAAPKRPEPNQFVVLIYNLFLADIQQSMAFLLNAAWVNKNAIEVGTPTCWAQGWFISTGDLASSMFITAIAIHTYITVARGYRPPQWTLYTAIVLLWAFVYGVSASGIAKTRNGRNAGGYYVRAAGWCWVNVKYENLRLVNHYLYIFIGLVVTCVFYTLTFLKIRGRPGSAMSNASSQGNNVSTPKMSLETRPGPAPAPPAGDAAEGGGYHPGFLAYPAIYVVCTLPLALGRIASMAGADVPIAFFCAAGVLIVSNGWLDALLWSATRRSLMFGPIDNSQALGPETFSFIRTPAERRWGNMVWVQGNTDAGEVQHYSDRAGGRSTSRWWGLPFGLAKRQPSLARDGRRSGQRHGQRRTGERSISQESLRGAGGTSDLLGNAIQMDTVTTVVVETDGDSKEGRQRQPSAHSMAGSERKASFQV